MQRYRRAAWIKLKNWRPPARFSPKRLSKAGKEYMLQRKTKRLNRDTITSHRGARTSLRSRHR